MKTEIKSWLPVFPGFYNTLFDPDSQISEELREMGYAMGEGECRNWDFWDNARYQLEIVQECCEVIQGWLPKESGIERVEFEGIRSPKEYNFSNDAVNVKYHVDMETFTPWIKAFLKEHAVEWAEYLSSRYQSRDGFMSFYSCDPAEWEVDTDGFARFERVENAGRVGRLFGEHAFGSLLEFYLRTVKDDPKMSLYYEATESFYIGEFINLPERSKA